MKTPSVSGPDIRPKKKKEERRVFLEPRLWEELTRCAEFHERAFAELHKLNGLRADDAQKVSRNDIIEGFLEWACKEYWKDKGGEPLDPKSDEYAKKAKSLAERIRADEQD